MIEAYFCKKRSWSKTPYCGVEVALLSEKVRIALIRFEGGAKLPMHHHPGWEHILVLHGMLKINDQIYSKGDFVLIPAETNHTIESFEASQYLTISEKEGVTFVNEC